MAQIDGVGLAAEGLQRRQLGPGPHGCVHRSRQAQIHRRKTEVALAADQSGRQAEGQPAAQQKLFEAAGELTGGEEVVEVAAEQKNRSLIGKDQVEKLPYCCWAVANG